MKKVKLQKDRVLGKELGHRSPTSQMQNNENYKETDQKISASYTLLGMVHDNVEISSILYQSGLNLCCFHTPSIVRMEPKESTCTK